MAEIIVSRLLARASKDSCQWKFTLAAALALAICSQTAMAQLRSGRVERTLYHDHMQPAPRRLVASPTAKPLTGKPLGQSVAANKMRQPSSAPDSQVVLASGKESILETKPSQQLAPPDVGHQHATPLVEPDAGVSEVASQPEVEYSGEPMGHSGCAHCGSGNCGGLACGANSCDGFADLAPGCYGGGCMSGCGPIARLLSRLSIRAEVPLFWRRAQGVPLLLTTAQVGTAADVAGEVGQATTQTLFGNRLIDEDLSAGFRITLGTWLGGDCYRGVLFRYWNVGNQDHDFNFDSNSNPIIARPFTNVTAAPTNDTQLVAFPGDSVGSARISSTSRVDGLDIALRRLA